MKKGRSVRDQPWHTHARFPVPPDYPATTAWAEPGEVIYPGLGAVDWQQYLDTIFQPRRRKRVRETARHLFLTNRRLVIVDEARWKKTDLSLADIDDVSVGRPPGAPEKMPIDEAVVQVVFRAGSQRRVVGWSTLRRDADLFAEMLRELVDAQRGDAPTWGVRAGLLPPRTGYVLPMLEADGEDFAHTTPLANGLRFGESLIPWSDIERALATKPGTIVFHFRAGSESSALFSGFGIRVADLGDAERVWADFVDDHGVPVTQQT